MFVCIPNNSVLQWLNVIVVLCDIKQFYYKFNILNAIESLLVYKKRCFQWKWYFAIVCRH